MFKDRVDAGRQLAERLGYLNSEDTVVLALPRGGVILGREVAAELDAPLGLILVRKISHPFFPEYALGAVVDHNQAVYGGENYRPINKVWSQRAEDSARKLNAQRRELYGSEHLDPEVENKTAVIVDDGIATGLTMKAAILAVQGKRPKKIVVASPVASSESIQTMKGIADEIVILYDPAHFKGSVGAHYLKFGQVDDEEVRAIMREEAYGLRQRIAAY